MHENDDLMDPGLDTLSRADLAEVGGPAYTVACVLDDWNRQLHGVVSSHHGAGLFLDLLAAEGWRVIPIDPGPSLDELLGPPTE